MNGKVQRSLPAEAWELRVSAEGQKHRGGMHRQRTATLHGAIAFCVDGMHKERYGVAHLIGIGSFGQQLSQNCCVLVLYRSMCRRTGVLHIDSQLCCTSPTKLFSHHLLAN
ncbi:hypothetical protein [Streptomyces lushanensis]|uniref:hypothetical protein n=1 Tax=Streptomyces lushanensis TaxID=1434255 RepID=UPI0014765CE3